MISIKQIQFNKYATQIWKKDIPEEPEKLNFAPSIIWI